MMKHKARISSLCITAAAGFVSASAMSGTLASYDSQKKSVINTKPEYTLSDDSAAVSYQGHTQDIPITFKDRITAGDINVSVDDYNFDGWYDLFIYGRCGEESLGTYWLWFPEDTEYRMAEDMAVIDGLAPYLTVFTAERKLVYNNWRHSLEFGFTDDGFRPLRFSKNFTEHLCDNRFYNYSLDDNGDLLLESVQLTKARGIFDAEERETDEDYIRVTDSAVEHMEGKTIVQVLDITDIFGRELKPLRSEVLPGFKEDIYGISVTRLDLDFDGTDDLCIKLEAREPDQGERYAYYRMDKKTGMYEKLEKLSEDGRQFAPDPFDKCLYYTECVKSETGPNVYSYYRWEDDAAVLRKREEHTNLGGKNGFEVKVFRYDDDGNEYLSPT